MTVDFENLAPVLSLSSRAVSPRPSDHFVEFYEDDSGLLDSLSRFVSGGLEAGDSVIIVATESHRRNLEVRLSDLGRNSSSVTWIDAAEALDVFMRGDLPDAATFKDHFGGLIENASPDGRGVRVFGEMVAVLWERGNTAAALQVEDLWNQLGETYNFRLFCGYPTGPFGGTNLGPLRSVCQRHTHVLANVQASF